MSLRRKNVNWIVLRSLLRSAVLLEHMGANLRSFVNNPLLRVFIWKRGKTPRLEEAWSLYHLWRHHFSQYLNERTWTSRMRWIVQDTQGIDLHSIVSGGDLTQLEKRTWKTCCRYFGYTLLVTHSFLSWFWVPYNENSKSSFFIIFYKYHSILPKRQNWT